MDGVGSRPGCAPKHAMAPCWSTNPTRQGKSLMLLRRLRPPEPGCGKRKINPIAIGHRVVHGGPEYDRPVLVDQNVLAHLEQYIPLAPLISRIILRRSARSFASPGTLQSPVSIRRFIAAMARWPIILRFPTVLSRRRPALRISWALLRVYCKPSARHCARRCIQARDCRPSWQRRLHVRSRHGRSIESSMGLPRSTGCRWARGPARSIPAWCSI